MFPTLQQEGVQNMPAKNEDQISLFGETLEQEVSSLFVVMNGKTVGKMEVGEIFDASVYDEFFAVSYVSSPKFFSKTTDGFHRIDFILGIDKSEMLEKFQRAVSWTKKVDVASRIRFMTDADETTQEKIANGSCRLHYGEVGTMIHSKLYLLRNEATGKYRVITGSANFSEAAFSTENKNYEIIRIDDDKDLFLTYKEQYFDPLWEATIDYIPERVRRQKREGSTIRIDAGEEQAEAVISECIKQGAKPEVHVTVSDVEALEKLAESCKMEKEVVDKTKEILEMLKKGKPKDGVFSSVTLSEFKKKLPKFKAIVTNLVPKNDDDLRRKSMYFDAKTSRVMVESEPNILIPYSEEISMEVVRDTLSRVHSFVGAYKRFTNLDEDLQHKIQQRVYESILFAFTSPFMSIIRKECLEKDGKQGLADVPRILLLGGKPRSGKTTALDFISRLVGSPDGQYYQYKDISGTKVVFGMMSENNVFPLFVDEVESGFLKKSNTANYGTGMIKAVTNELEESGPVFFGTTNMDEFSASDAAMRRIYYLAVSNTYNEGEKKESQRVLEEAEFGLDDSLFREFTRRFSASILDGEDVYDSSDFLMQTRKIFRQIYEDAGVEIPDYFPSHIFHDYRDRQRDAWNTVWNTHREAFAPNGKDFLYCLIDKIASRQSERTYLMNLLPSECIQSNAGIAWNLHRQKFYDFIGYERPLAEKARDMMYGLLHKD